MKPAAKQGDVVLATDTHLVVTPGGAVVAVALPFGGIIDSGLAATVLIEHKPAAVDGSAATNVSAHVAAGGTFVKPPSNRGRIIATGTVLANHKLLAKAGDAAITCNDPNDVPAGKVIAESTVRVGG